MGQVEKFATITPNIVHLRGEEGAAVVKTVRIAPVEKYPFKITKVTASPNSAFQYTLEESGEKESSDYILTVSDPNPAGRYSGTVFLHTDNKLKSKISIRVIGNFRKPRVQNKETTKSKEPAPQG